MLKNLKKILRPANLLVLILIIFIIYQSNYYKNEAAGFYSIQLKQQGYTIIRKISYHTIIKEIPKIIVKKAKAIYITKFKILPNYVNQDLKLKIIDMGNKSYGKAEINGKVVKIPIFSYKKRYKVGIDIRLFSDFQLSCGLTYHNISAGLLIKDNLQLKWYIGYSFYL